MTDKDLEKRIQALEKYQQEHEYLHNELLADSLRNIYDKLFNLYKKLRELETKP